MAIPSQAFADTARRVYEKQIPYKRGGKDLRGMDSGGFIEYCLKQHGVNCSFSGTNDLYRKLGPVRIPLKQAIREKKVVPGALLLHVIDDGGEPDRYKADGLGNCDYGMIAISSTEGVYPSEKLKGFIKREIKIENGKPNMVLLCKYIDYGFSDNSEPSAPAPAYDVVYTTTVLNLRKAPSTKADGIKTMREGTRLELLEYGPEWCKVKYIAADGTPHIGWCASKYLTLD